jgi:hypothetical protein
MKKLILLILHFCLLNAQPEPPLQQIQPIVPINQNQNPQISGIFNGILNSVQLNMKRLVGNIIPAFSIDNGVVSNENTLQRGDDTFQAFQYATLPPPFHSFFTGCPSTCIPLNPDQLPDTWHLMYASDNFVKLRFADFSRLYERRLTGNITVRDVFVAPREPICTSIQGECV